MSDNTYFYNFSIDNPEGTDLSLNLHNKIKYTDKEVNINSLLFSSKNKKKTVIHLLKRI